ncbi:hypothetical protein COU77_01310 [Candidatus Peregrinibacteria bacterium CG10_big_fil_rev_8_21_14_0_10_49_16]|nr:MAG: hypothetical protein COW95_03555 [Candidatus Peregrinibacteria bacterium CG22_combo_CG10-13_8_21_14_all_49_11]PIR52250.1 MAG: hypothetical protein COU77_01310 [Candidatus Peregrinibacteria bacterium CG10_big_fil_rev_8_21_14_0_10_49_16]
MNISEQPEVTVEDPYPSKEDVSGEPRLQVSLVAREQSESQRVHREFVQKVMQMDGDWAS